jgi:hypothetical protein
MSITKLWHRMQCKLRKIFYQEVNLIQLPVLILAQL